MMSSQEMFECETPQQRKRRLNKEKQSHYRKRPKIQQDLGIRRHELGRMDQLCIHCGARF